MRQRCRWHVWARMRVGPTSRKKSFMILVDRCWKCDLLVPVRPENLKYVECIWLEKMNKRAGVGGPPA